MKNKQPLNLTGIKGVIFDLDGTLVTSSLDFSKMRAEIGCPHDCDILEFIDRISCSHTKEKANQTVLQHELEDAHSAKMLPNGKLMLEQVVSLNLPMAIVTRNCREATSIKLKMNKIAISNVLTREDAAPKPDPAGLLQIASEWQINSESILYVGDYIYDQKAAENARMQFQLV